MRRVFALLPAAGKSERMGRPKLTLPLAGRTVLEHVVVTLQRAGIKEILVVLGPHVAELEAVARRCGAHALLLSEETADMRATVERGLDWLEERYRPVAEDRWLLLPADHPVLDADVVRTLLDQVEKEKERTIVLPTFEGRRGHPTSIGWSHVPAIRALEPGCGLNIYFRRHAEQTREVPVSTATVLLDLDTPEDYERLLDAYG